MIFQINLFAQLQGNPGEVFPIKINPNIDDESFTLEINESTYKLIALPYSKQGEYLKVGKKSIFINEKDFGESRITIEDSSKVTLGDP